MALTLSKQARWSLAGLIVACLALAGWFIYRSFHPGGPTLDASMIKALEQASGTTSYVQEVDTETKFPDRYIKINGTYLVDNASKHYASYSTTTLFITKDPTPHVFTHQDIAIGDDVYTKVETNDPLLKQSIQNSPDWAYFKNGSIPAAKASIAIAGPVQDNLQVLSQKGAFISLVQKDGPSHWGAEQLLRYTFKFNDKASSLEEGPLKAVYGRIGKNGTVDVWIDPAIFVVRHMVFANAPYFSTTTISQANAQLQITPPIQKPS